MLLSTLVQDLCPIESSLDCEILGLAQNSSQVQPGYLFLAWQGKTFDGRVYLDEALDKGASAVLLEGEAGTELAWRQGKPLITIPQLRSHLAELAARFLNYPAKKLRLIGITGTNGKTSTAHFIAQALTLLEQPCGIIGTLGNGLPGALQEAAMTTPDSLSLQQIFADLLKQQVNFVSMEVSSHSLDQERVKGLAFEVGIFTNLTQDHLDYHGNMTLYGEAKKRLFTEYSLGHAAINIDDPFGRELKQSLKGLEVVGYSVKEQAADLVYAQNPRFDLSGISATVHTPWGSGELSAPLIGEFNLSNLLAVLTTLGLLGIPLKAALAAMKQLKPVPGRMQIFGGKSQPTLVVDYAHTPDALEKALLGLRKHCQGKLLCLFGCGGGRDREKRPRMAEMVERHADLIMVTSDNPRFEDPKAIIQDILAGFKNSKAVRVEEDRSKAIQDIIQWATKDDYVLIAGKGAETYQQLGAVKIPFSDAEKIKEYL